MNNFAKAYSLAVVFYCAVSAALGVFDLLSAFVASAIWTAIAWRVGYMRKLQEQKA